MKFVARLRNGERMTDLGREFGITGRRGTSSWNASKSEGCGRTARADKAKRYTIARGSAMECAAHLDVMKLDELVESELYESGVELLERIVAMLTKLIEP